MTTANLTPIVPQLALSDSRFPAFIRHLVKREHYTAGDVLDVIERPQNHQKKFIAHLCGVNADDYRPGDTWDAFLARNVKWREFEETGIEIDTPQLVVDLSDVLADERPAEREKVKFQVRAHNLLLCPDLFNQWSVMGTAYLEDRFGRPCVVWEVEQSV